MIEKPGGWFPETDIDKRKKKEAIKEKITQWPINGHTPSQVEAILKEQREKKNRF